MPVFEYRCRHCGRIFERLVPRSLPGVECPTCGKADPEQLISLCAVSSEGTRRANLRAAHTRAATVRAEKAHQSHADLHQHFEDSPMARGGKE
jgi:putative FmdB family regulatory protein